MPSNKTRDRLKKEAANAAKRVELTGKNDIIYTTVAITPVIDKVTDSVVFKIQEIRFTIDKQIVSMVEIDSARTMGTALNKLENAFNETTYNIKQLRNVAKQLKKELEE